MRTEGQVKQKLKQAQYRHLKRELRRKFGNADTWPKGEVDLTKATLRRFFSTATIPEVAKDYPDVAALMWVLEAQPSQPLMRDGFLVGRMGGVMLWADSEEDADVARSMIDKIVDAATREPEPSEPQAFSTYEVGGTLISSGIPELPVLPTIKKSWWQRLFG